MRHPTFHEWTSSLGNCSLEINCGYGKFSKYTHTASQTDENTISAGCELTDELSNPPTAKEKEDKETQTETSPILSQTTQTMNTNRQDSTPTDIGSVTPLIELNVCSESVCDTKYVSQDGKEYVKKEIAPKSHSCSTIDVPQVKYENKEKEHATKRESDDTTFGLLDEFDNSDKLAPKSGVHIIIDNLVDEYKNKAKNIPPKSDSESTADDLQDEYENVDNNMASKINVNSTTDDAKIENGNPASKKIFNINFHAERFISSYNSSYFICPKKYERGLERFESINKFNTYVTDNRESIKLNNTRYSTIYMNEPSQKKDDFLNGFSQNNRLKNIKNNSKNSIIDCEVNNSTNELSDRSSSDFILLFDKCKPLRRTYSTITLPLSLDNTADYEKIKIVNRNNSCATILNNSNFNQNQQPKGMVAHCELPNSEDNDNGRNKVYSHLTLSKGRHETNSNVVNKLKNHHNNNDNNKRRIQSAYLKGMKQIEAWFYVINNVIHTHTGVNTYALSRPIVLYDNMPINVFSENCQRTEPLRRLQSQDDYLSSDIVFFKSSNCLSSESSLDYCKRTNDNAKHQKDILNNVKPDSNLLQDDIFTNGQHPKSLKRSGDNTNLLKVIGDLKIPSLESITSPATIQIKEDRKESIEPLKKRNITKLLCIENIFLRRGNSKFKQSKGKKSRKLFCFGC